MTLAVTLGYFGGRVSRSHRTVPVSADTFAATWSPLAAEGRATYLAAGGSGGGAAITYLKFQVDLPGGRLPTRAELWLTRQAVRCRSWLNSPMYRPPAGRRPDSELFPRVKAMMYFDTPSQQQGRDSRVDVTETGLMAYRRLGQSPVFSVMPAANRPVSSY